MEDEVEDAESVVHPYPGVFPPPVRIGRGRGGGVGPVHAEWARGCGGGRLGVCTA